jgi:hypothetical protein
MLAVVVVNVYRMVLPGVFVERARHTKTHSSFARIMQLTHATTLTQLPGQARNGSRIGLRPWQRCMVAPRPKLPVP